MTCPFVEVAGGRFRFAPDAGTYGSTGHGVGEMAFAFATRSLREVRRAFSRPSPCDEGIICICSILIDGWMRRAEDCDLEDGREELTSNVSIRVDLESQAEGDMSNTHMRWNLNCQGVV